MMIVDALELFDIEGVTAVSGEEALRRVEDSVPAAIILDLMMPNMNGFGVIHRLRQKAASRDIPVIILSAVADSPGGIGRLPGVVGVICKGDFSLDRFRTVLGAAGIAA